MRFCRAGAGLEVVTASAPGAEAIIITAAAPAKGRLNAAHRAVWGRSEGGASDAGEMPVAPRWRREARESDGERLAAAPAIPAGGMKVDCPMIDISSKCVKQDNAT